MSNNMIVMFRVDASIQMGSGHVMRCLTLADAISKKNVHCFFICRQHSGNMISFIKDKGYTVLPLPCPKANWQCVTRDNNTLEHAEWLGATQGNDAQESINALQLLGQKKKIDWIIVDHYALDYRWHQQLKTHAHKLMVIDDLADRLHDCDLLLDQNFYLNLESRYKCLVPDYCSLMLGSRYVLLRDEFVNAAKNADHLNKSSIHLFIFMGGVDGTDETNKAINAISLLYLEDIKILVDVVVGSGNPKADQIEARCNKLENVLFHKEVNNIAALMSKADIAIGAGGATTLERCYLGLPSLVIMIAENQIETTNALSTVGVIKSLGWYENVNAEVIAKELKQLLSSPEELASMKEKSLSIFNKNQSGSYIVTEALLGLL